MEIDEVFDFDIEAEEDIEDLFLKVFGNDTPNFDIIQNLMIKARSLETELSLATAFALCNLDQEEGLEAVKASSPGQASCRKPLTLGVDVAWKCLDCELDDTSIICAECYENGPHKNHRAILRNRVSGCCDCGDPCAWKTSGNCSLHQGITREFISQSLDCLPTYVQVAFRTTVQAIYQLIVNDGEVRTLGWQSRNDKRILWLTEMSNVGPAFMHLVATEMLKSYSTENTMKCEYRKLQGLDLLGQTEILDLWEYPLESEDPHSCQCSALDIIIKFWHHMTSQHRSNIEDFFMAVLSDPDWKAQMTYSFMKHYELLFKTMQDGYNLIRYSVQIFTAEDMALLIVGNSEIFETSLGILEIFLARSFYEERAKRDVSKYVYDAIWNMFINLKYLLSKNSAVEIALTQTSLISTFARAFSRVYRYNSVIPRTNHILYDQTSFKSKCYAVEQFMYEPIKHIAPILSALLKDQVNMESHMDTIARVMHQLTQQEHSPHIMVLRYLWHIFWRTDSQRLLTPDLLEILVRETAHTIGFIDSISVNKWVYHGTVMKHNATVYYTHYNHFYEVDLAILQLCVQYHDDFWELYVNSFSDIKQLIDYIMNEEGDVDSKTIELGPYFFRKIVQMILLQNYASVVADDAGEIKVRLKQSAIQLLWTGTQKFSAFKSELPKHFKKHPDLQDVIEEISTPVNQACCLKESFWVYYDPWLYINLDDQSNSASNAEFMLKKDQDSVDTIIGSIQWLEQNQLSARIAEKLLPSLEPLIRKVFKLAVEEDDKIQHTVIYACLKLLQIFVKLCAYTIPEDIQTVLNVLKGKTPHISRTINRLLNIVQEGQDPAAIAKAAKIASAKARFEEFKRKQDEQFDKNRHLMDISSSSGEENEKLEPCSLCMEPLDSDYGYVAYVQKSKVLSQIVEDTSNLPYVEGTNGMFISTCGHKIHVKCFKTLKKTKSSRSGSVQLGKHEYLWNLCKNLCNIFIPCIHSSLLEDDRSVGSTPVEELRNRWNGYGDLSEDNEVADLPPISQLSSQLIEHYISEGLDREEAYQAALLELDFSQSSQDTISRSHNVTETPDGRFPSSLKHVVVGAIRILYNTWTDNVTSPTDGLMEITNVLRSLMGALLVNVGMQGWDGFSKQADLYLNLYRVITSYIKLESFAEYVMAVHQYWSAMTMDQQPQTDWNPYTTAGLAEIPQRPPCFDAIPNLIDVSLFGLSRFRHVPGAKDILGEQALAARLYQTYHSLPEDQSSTASCLLPVYRILVALDVIHGKLVYSGLDSAKSMDPMSEISALKQILGINLTPQDLWELGNQFYASRSLPQPLMRSNFKLFSIPDSYMEMIQTFYKLEWPNCGKRPQTPAVCLIWGTVVCRVEECCKVAGVGESTRHAQDCGWSQGAFIDVTNGEFYIISGIRAAPYESAYVNTYKESRTRNVRESDLEWFLDEEKYQKLQQAYMQHRICSIIVAQKLSGADLIYRDSVL